MAASKFKMSDAELLDYMDAATDPNKALDVLAVKCRTTRQIMREHLGNLGIVLEDEPAPEKKVLDGFKPVTPKKRVAHNKKMDETKAREMYNAGAADHEIAAAFGMSNVAVYYWRKKHNLPANYRPGGGKMKGAVKEVSEKRPVEDTVIEESEQRERAFEEILESVDAGKRKPCQPTPEPAGEQAETEPLLTVGGFIQLLMSLTNERTRAVGLVLNGQYVRDIHRLIVDSTSGTLTVEVETC